MTTYRAAVSGLALLALALAGCAGPNASLTPVTSTSAPAPSTQAVAPSPRPSPAAHSTHGAAPTVWPQAVQRKVQVTYYAAADNDPPGSTQIAYPNSRHPSAGGSGTVADPLSLATDPREIRPGVLVYYPTVRKYFVMEDDCAPCIDQWSQDRTPHVDLWMSNATAPVVQECEAALTPDDPDTIVVNAPTDLPVDTRPLFSGGRCWPNT